MFMNNEGGSINNVCVYMHKFEDFYEVIIKNCIYNYIYLYIHVRTEKKNCIHILEKNIN